MFPTRNPAWPGSRFRTGFTQGQGLISAKIIQARVVSVNVVNWTVDVLSWADRHKIDDVQVASPYLHYSRGEGIYCLPEVGAVCNVTYPSDSSPPYISSFVMPYQTLPVAPEDSTSTNNIAPVKPGSASFGGGREIGKPGDLFMRGRDGNFVKLHRGGVLEIGCTEVAKRMFIPMTNHIMDVAEQYTLMSSGGSIRWGISDTISSGSPQSQYQETFRVYANDDYADIRVTKGYVANPTTESADEDKGELIKSREFELGTKATAPIVYEFVVAKKGFSPYGGAPKDNAIGDRTVFRFYFDRDGGTFFRCQGNMLIAGKKKVHIHVQEELTIRSEKTIELNAKEGITMVAPDVFHVKSNLTKMGGGVTPAARQGDMVQCIVPPGLLIVAGVTATPGMPIVATVAGTITGVIITGNPGVLL